MKRGVRRSGLVAFSIGPPSDRRSAPTAVSLVEKFERFSLLSISNRPTLFYSPMAVAPGRSQSPCHQHDFKRPRAPRVERIPFDSLEWTNRFAE